ncbi:MAG: hypothetical protein H3C30_10740 [Candidatus Hydrogenedentes bacterium]|nr:hypothetical protein [Candidatus Hydrogenedentota bacterium]
MSGSEKFAASEMLKRAPVSQRVVSDVCLVPLDNEVVCLFNPGQFNPVRVEGESRQIRAMLRRPVAEMPAALAVFLEQHGIVTSDGGKSHPVPANGRRGLILCMATRNEVTRLEQEWPEVTARHVGADQADARRSRGGPASLEVVLIADKSGETYLTEMCQRVRAHVLSSKIPVLLRARMSLADLSRESELLSQILKPSFRYAVDCSKANSVSEILDKAAPIVDAGFRPNLCFSLSRGTIRRFPDCLAELRGAWCDDFTYDLDFTADHGVMPSSRQMSLLLERLSGETRTQVLQQGRIAFLRSILAGGAGADLGQLTASVLFASPGLKTSSERLTDSVLPYPGTQSIALLLAEHALMSISADKADSEADRILAHHSIRKALDILTQILPEACGTGSHHFDCQRGEVTLNPARQYSE